jgi:acyl-CoA thioester hydrolase
MGFMHHSTYVKYFEQGRIELMRAVGMPYADLEKNGIICPVLDMYIKYHKSAFFDDLITVKTWIGKVVRSKVVFNYEIYKGDTLITTAYTTLAFLDAKTMRPTIKKDEFLNLVKDYIQDEEN